MSRSLLAYISFFKQLSNALTSGLSIDDALALLSSDIRNTKASTQIALFQTSLQKGLSFTESFSIAFSHIFPVHLHDDCQLGSISVFLSDVASYLDDKRQFQDQLFSQLRYPFFLLCSFLGLLVVFGHILLPNYFYFFSVLGITPPQALLTAQSLFSMTFLGGLSSILLFIAVVLYRYKATFLNIFRTRFLRSIDAIFFRLLSLLLSSGLSLNNAISSLNFSRHHNLFYPTLLLKMSVSSTGNFSENIARIFRLSDYHKALLLSAEKTGSIDNVLAHISHDLNDKSNRTISSAISIVQPVILFLMGGLVLGIVYATFIPILHVISSL